MFKVDSDIFNGVFYRLFLMSEISIIDFVAKNKKIKISNQQEI